jgi:hypothetical protein
MLPVLLHIDIVLSETRGMLDFQTLNQWYGSNFAWSGSDYEALWQMS